MTHAIRATWFVLLMQGTSSIHGQPTIEWQKCHGSDGPQYASNATQCADGGYIVAGMTEGGGGMISGYHGGAIDYWVVRLDANGNMLWQKCLGGSGGDTGRFVQQTADGGFIVVGNSDSNDGDVSGNDGSSNIWVVKLYSDGNIQWQKVLVGHDDAHCIRQAMDGGYVVAGGTGVLKLDATGNLQWHQIGPIATFHSTNDVRQTTDGGFIVAGYSGYIDTDFWVAKLDSGGDLEWQRTLGGSEDDLATSIQQTSDGGYIVAGITASNDGDVSGSHGGPSPFDNSDYWVVKLDDSGALLWQKCLGGYGPDAAYSITQVQDGGYLVAGSSNAIDGDITDPWGYGDIWVVKLDGSGNLLWDRSLGGYDSDGAGSIEQTSDGGSIIAGYTRSANNGDVTGHHGMSDCWVVKLSPDVVGMDEGTATRLSLSPNPTNGSLRITLANGGSLRYLRLYDATGRIALEGSVGGMVDVLSIDIGGLASGPYLLRLDLADGTSTTGRVLKE